MPQSNLSGTIPASLRQLGNLEELDLGGNSLTGTIPSELGDLALLKQLSLYDNRLTVDRSFRIWAVWLDWNG